MANQVTGKAKAARIPLDYYKHHDMLHTWQSRLGWLALIVPVLWCGAGLALSGQGDCHASRGPVASVHQNWDASCSTCHVNFTPINSNSFRVPGIMGDPLESSKKCQTCHAGPAHFHGQPDDRTCASCHREHRGPDISLVNLPDSDCTQCHRDFKAHFVTKEFTADVTHFAKAAHPEFRSIKADTGKLKFNHQRHLTAGMGVEMKLNDKKLPDAAKNRYREQQKDKGAESLIQLDCASCHRLDSGDFGVDKKQANDFPFNIAGKRSGGSYMQPIVYENQCQACHPLSLLNKVPGDPKSGEFSIPHRMQPAEIHELLDHFFVSRLARGDTGFLAKKSTRPLPGKLLDPGDRQKVDEEVTRAELLLYLSKEVQRSEKDLYLSKRMCAECHYFEGKAVAEAIKPDKAPDLHVAPTNVPTVWLKHAKFNHTAHRAVDCKSCHRGALDSKEHTDVLIPNMDNCVKCHAPKAGNEGGVRHNCTECHQYHHGEQPLQGVGATRRSPQKLHKVEDFLSIK